MAYEFILGVDVVESEADQLSLALAILEKEAGANDEAPRYRLELLEEESGFDDTDAVAERIQNLLTKKPYVARTVPIANRTTAYGQDVLAALSERGLAPVGATLSPGSTTMSGSRDEMNAVVSVRDAIDILQTLYHGGQLDTMPQQDTDEASRLVRGIERFGESGTDEMGEERRVDMAVSPDEGPYDAIVVSTALACWLGEEQTFDPTQHLKEELQGGGLRE